jgi:hypothetical protein
MLTLSGSEEEVRLHLAVCELRCYQHQILRRTLPNGARAVCVWIQWYQNNRQYMSRVRGCEMRVLPDNKGAGPLGLSDRLDLSSGKAVDAPNVVSVRRREQRELKSKYIIILCWRY